ncbi:MAG: VanZ family protein [Bacillota bacterium]|nr:VanZ family protein [Bacillota bacterium]
MKVKFITIASLVLTLCFAVSIFVFSGQSADVSKAHSTVITERVDEIVNQGEGKYSFGQLHHFVRKSAHFLEFMGLGLFAFLTVESWRPKLWRNAARAQIFAACYAVSDELHQLYSAGRSCEIRDMLLDSAGAAIGILIAIACCLIIRSIKKPE